MYSNFYRSYYDSTCCTDSNLDSNATDDTICAGSAVIITADDVPGATYTFRLNGLAVPAGDVGRCIRPVLLHRSL